MGILDCLDVLRKVHKSARYTIAGFSHGDAECFNTVRYQPLSHQRQFLSLIPNSIMVFENLIVDLEISDRYTERS
ncbi:hypothetical protein PN465_14160 [Nodularia spumigena CS-584]|uniref:Uncharacterized protein n=1 Tax=Nodularia spumigena UHCC 0060 TaxID=3110300 RepID=A0ABU5UXB5_NODSP|nr:hypothetical protein [Nodularia spumigena]AHJ30838.1 hypothetical protein NSP_45420 [Nodularia spumigena CCY9414]MDB9383354.1 hypothetical protein [Nodularia spumigena CS-584]MEA5526771.1 hypothetical protein [Nodularia spumigena UHCC 0143]MEA5558476.1 hypothetical protein [Nodularia spumigena CH309]MEA5610170.1 hypothetical protein [Nodularia spumigena UHCC 0060]